MELVAQLSNAPEIATASFGRNPSAESALSGVGFISASLSLARPVGAEAEEQKRKLSLASPPEETPSAKRAVAYFAERPASLSPVQLLACRILHIRILNLGNQPRPSEVEHKNLQPRSYTRCNRKIEYWRQILF